MGIYRQLVSATANVLIKFSLTVHADSEVAAIKKKWSEVEPILQQSNTGS